MAKNKVEMINRKEYDRIRRMDHSQMSGFVAEIYRKGYTEGKKDAEGITETEVRNALLTVRGIGEKKEADIIRAIAIVKQTGWEESL